jgi:hypothetical protein
MFFMGVGKMEFENSGRFCRCNRADARNFAYLGHAVKHGRALRGDFTEKSSAARLAARWHPD